MKERKDTGLKSGKAAGGHARAKSLTAEERKEIARKAAEARWGNELPRATHRGDLEIGGLQIPCYVLEDGTRVFSKSGLQHGVGMSRSGGRSGDQRIAVFMDALEKKAIEVNDLAARIREPIHFYPMGGGRSAYGYEATILADICDVVFSARKAGALRPNQIHIAERCELLMRGFARVGIVALVDEATGYQEVRDRDALQAILEKYLRKEFATWAKRFPDEFYQHIFRLRKWEWRGMKVNRPQVVATYTKDIVYKRLAPGILKELEAKNPRKKGKRKVKHHQWLTDDIGHPALERHIYAVLGLMRIADSWSQLMGLINRAYPIKGDSLQTEMFDLTT